MHFGFFGNLALRLRLARDLPPRLVAAKIRKRLPWTDKAKVRIDEVLYAPTQSDPGRLTAFLENYEAKLEADIGWSRLDFAGRRVLEIGPGPLAGWGPLAIFRGAEEVRGIEPDWVAGTLADPRIERSYLRPLFDDLTRRYGARMTFSGFRTALAERLHVEAAPLAKACPARPAEIVLSNSCLEHVEDLGQAVAALARLMSPSARFLHLVNFGNHRDRERPFARIYAMPPDRYFLRYGPHINLARPPDVMAAFARAGLDAVLVPLDRRPELLRGERIHPYWRERYDLDTLAIRTALIISAEGRREPHCRQDTREEGSGTPQ